VNVWAGNILLAVPRPDEERSTSSYSHRERKASKGVSTLVGGKRLFKRDSKHASIICRGGAGLGVRGLPQNDGKLFQISDGHESRHILLPAKAIKKGG